MIETGIVLRKSFPDLTGEIPDHVDGLLGSSFLQRFRLVLDYGNDIAWLEPHATGTAAASERTQGAQVGIQLESVWGELRVAQVEVGSPAERAGIRQGDLLVGIDQIRVGSFEAPAAARLLLGAPGSEIVLAVRRGGLEQVLRLERQSR